jgi:DNA-binding transcriptional MerR regulator
MPQWSSFTRFDILTRHLFQVVDPEPSRNRSVGQWKRPSRMDVDTPSTPLGSAASLASTLDGVLAAMTGRAPALPNLSSGENAAALQALKDMGFPESRCKKALLLNNMDVEAALGWICDHMNDDDIDDPLTDEQLRQVDRMMKEKAQKQHQDTAETKRQREKEELESCVQQNTCTYAVTGPRMAVVPEYFMCYTCGLDGSKGCCAACATICHAGHVLHRKVLPPTGSFYCDCPESGSCKCCPPESMPRK